MLHIVERLGLTADRIPEIKGLLVILLVGSAGKLSGPRYLDKISQKVDTVVGSSILLPDRITFLTVDGSELRR